MPTMKLINYNLLWLMIFGIVISGCQTTSQTPTPPLPTETLVPTYIPSTLTSTAMVADKPTATPEPSPTAKPLPTSTPTLSLEESYEIPTGWQLVDADPSIDERDDWTTVIDGLYFALPPEWSCQETPDDAGSTYVCILDMSADRFENQRKTRLIIDSYWVKGGTTISDLAADYKENRAFYDYACESNFITVDGLEAVSLSCINPAYDDQIDYDTDREAYGEANARQIPEYYFCIINGDRIDVFHFRTWDNSQMPTLFETLIPYIHYVGE
jgi:hypothetical protein